MQVTVETGEGLARRMKVELPPEEIEQEIEKRLRDVARSARLPGFRPGKVPMRVLRQRFGESVRGEVFSEMVSSSFSKAISQEQLQPAGMPDIEPDVDQGESRYAYVAKFEVLPQIELQGLEGKEIKRPVAEVTDADIDKMIDRLREQRKTWNAVERAGADGDRLTISFEGSVDGEAFPGGSGEDVPLELGAGRMISGFEEQLVGASAGDERDVEVTFPEDYPAEHLAGKQAHFKVRVKEVAEAVLPEIDADMIRSFGVEDGNVEKFRADIRQNMERELKQRIEANVKNQVMDALVEANPVDLPAVLVAEEVKALKEQTLRGAGGATMELPDSLFEESARRRVALGLIIAEAAKRHDISPVPERVRAAVDEMASTYETPQAVVDYYYADRQRLASVESLVVEEMVVEHMLEQADVRDEPRTFAELTENADSA
ncbi:MAG: trigger factor [Thiohalocapsa sp.]|nr:trigger factor [Thiohalocapsa sp.]MCF7990052.1 trigger factor [Thiohalocapsa sp.]